MNIILVGASGAVGSKVVEILISSSEINNITLLNRRYLDKYDSCEKVTQIITDFSSLSDLDRSLIKNCDLALSLLGSGLASSLFNTKNLYNVEYLYPTIFAQLCKDIGVKNFGLITMDGANSKSIIPINKYKGLLEKYISSCDFERIIIFKPRFLDRGLKGNWYERGNKYMPDTVSVEKIADHIFINIIKNEKGVFYFDYKSLAKDISVK